MANLPLLADVRALPQASDSRGVERGFERLSERAEQCQDAALAAFTEELGRDAEGKALLDAAAGQLRLTARGYHRVLRVARTLADLEGSGAVRRIHVAEALSYRRIVLGR